VPDIASNQTNPTFGKKDNILEIFNTVTNSVIALSTSATAYIAWKGFDAWKAPYKSKREYELACKILCLVYSYRDVMDQTRFDAHHHSPVSEEEEPTKTIEERKFLGRVRLYENLQIRATEIRTGIYSYILESEALWGNELLKEIDKLIFQEGFLSRCVSEYLTLFDPAINEDQKQYSKMLLAMHMPGGFFKLSDEDEFSQNLVPHRASFLSAGQRLSSGQAERIPSVLAP